MEFDLMQLLSTVGLPGVLCIILLKQQDKMRDIVDNNTKAIVELSAIIKGDIRHGSE